MKEYSESNQQNVPELSMSSLTALKLSIEYHNNDAELLSSHLKANDPAWSHLNWKVAEQWRELITLPNQTTLLLLCQEACLHFVLSKPILLQLTRHGREGLISSLSSDELQVFRNGGLLEETPTFETIMWWDKLKSIGRKLIDADLLQQGREAERLTFENELKLVADLGNLYKPKWVALESDRYGYDILTYRKQPDGSINTLRLEVKSFAWLSNPHFYVTENEWKTASDSNANNYLFVVWCMATKECRTFTVDEVEVHISKNQGTGRWQNILIDIRNWK
jgi:hypothetical protein